MSNYERRGLNLGLKTVDTYRTRLKEKLGLKNAAELHHRAVHWVKELELRAAKPFLNQAAPE